MRKNSRIRASHLYFKTDLIPYGFLGPDEQVEETFIISR